MSELRLMSIIHVRIFVNFLNKINYFKNNMICLLLHVTSHVTISLYNLSVSIQSFYSQ